MIKRIEHVLHEVFFLDGIDISIVENEMRSQVMNGQYYDVIRDGKTVVSFCLNDFVDAFNQSPLSEDEVMHEVIMTLIDTINIGLAEER